MRFARAILYLLLLCAALPARAEEEIALYNSLGEAIAYVAFDDGANIFTWDGRPVAYIDTEDTREGVAVFGFNGRHLGWFDNGFIRDRNGKVACATRDHIRRPLMPRLKSNKHMIPMKSMQRMKDSLPDPQNKWSELGCSIFLQSGQK